MQSTSNAARIQIGIFGKTNTGKSSLINALTGQNLAITSSIAGTTTDPVKKAMELFPLGPVMLTDTPGLDDTGELGKERSQRTHAVLAATDIAIIVVDAANGWSHTEAKLLQKIQAENITCVVIFNKSDLGNCPIPALDCPTLSVSCKTMENIEELKNLLGKLKPQQNTKPLVHDLFSPKDIIILVTPIDLSTPKGRLILPQQQVLRDILDYKGIAIVTQPEELADTLSNLKSSPRLVITDSQVFEEVNTILPPKIPLTSFSILFARYKGNLDGAIAGVNVLDSIQDNDEILIGEGCTHHRQCGDIGTEKIPNWIKKYTKANPKFTFTAGNDFPEDLSKYKLIIHCGGCMLTEKEMQNRLNKTKNCDIAFTNYGIVIAKIKGILKRATEIFLNE
ncbi:MAG: [FeFe] hydrogenase H-cluster maturation GTPase HydF [Acidaminococcaceae bacterium]|nr:[FeFe] hydrogenase H-cluster maturation GTPase HydF [Acidaminococcaceae bacterium]